MSDPLEGLLANLLGDFTSGLRIEDDAVGVRLLRFSNFELQFERPEPQRAAEMRESEGDAYAIPVRVRLINRNSGKEVRGFDKNYINPWWLRTFVFELAAAVAYIEREWDVMSEEFVSKMQEQG